MLLDALYYATLAVHFTHELDAVKRREWRILPLTSYLPERLGEQVFIWLHVPLFLAIPGLGERATAAGFRAALAGLAVIHVGLHWLLRKHPAYEFDNPSPLALILLAGAVGAIYLLAASVSSR